MKYALCADDGKLSLVDIQVTADNLQERLDVLTADSRIVHAEPLAEYDQAVTPETHYYTGSYITNRPSLPVVPTPIVVGALTSSYKFPAETVVECYYEGQFVERWEIAQDNLLEFELGDTGEWELRLLPPFPWLSKDAKITVVEPEDAEA